MTWTLIRRKATPSALETFLHQCAAENGGHDFFQLNPLMPTTDLHFACRKCGEIRHTQFTLAPRSLRSK